MDINVLRKAQGTASAHALLTQLAAFRQEDARAREAFERQLNDRYATFERRFDEFVSVANYTRTTLQKTSFLANRFFLVSIIFGSIILLASCWQISWRMAFQAGHDIGYLQAASTAKTHPGIWHDYLHKMKI
jgi:hypothetical protein